MLNNIIKKLEKYEYETIELSYDRDDEEYILEIKGRFNCYCVCCCDGEYDFIICCSGNTEEDVVNKAIFDIENLIKSGKIKTAYGGV